MGAMTSYHAPRKRGWDNPNRPGFYCTPCAEDYRSYWTEMWDEYNRGRL